MEPEAEDPDNNDKVVPWSGSDGSQELCESYNEDDASDAEYPFDPLPAHIPMSESPERLQSQDWESAGEQYSLPEFSGSEEDISYQEEDDYLSESRESITESPLIEPSPTSQSPHQQHPESEPHAGQISRLHSQSSSSSLGCAADMTLALTLTTEQPLGASNRQGPGTRNRRVESSEEGGSSEAPPSSIFFGISDKAAEQAEKWNSEANTDLCRPDRHRARSTQLSHNESQSERNVKETKSKCKQIARLLTDAPNPRNKGALLFEKRRQRVKKYTLVSYGTGENKLDSKDQIEEETEVRSAGYNCIATSESELEEEYSVYHRQRNLSLNWESVGEMEALPETKGKGVMMFAQRRKRMDDIVSEHEELRNKGLPAETLTEPERTEVQTMYDTEEMYVHTDQANYMDANLQQHIEHQQSLQQMNHLSNVPRPLVSNRTAKPFLGFHVSTTVPALPGGVLPVTKKHEPRFRVPVPINTHPQVWSPTGDIIASRDERISVPAIKTGILPESKRKVTNKQQSMLAQGSHFHLQNKGERRSYIETEEDCFSLGAEACNFMQPRTIKLKNPPPVAPKPTINPSCPPWMGRLPSGEPCIPPRSPVSQPSHSPVLTHSQHYLQQQDWAQPQHMGNHWAPNQTQATLQTPANAWVPVNSSSQLHLQPTTNSWSQQLSQSPGFGRSHSLSLPKRLNSMPSPRVVSPASTLGIQSSFLPAQRQTSFQEKVHKPLSPWDAASRSPIGSVDDAFVFQSLPSSVASNVKATAHRRSLPEPPDEWKRRVSLDPAAVSMAHYHPAPAFQAPFMSRTFSPEKPAFYGPPFRPAQPLGPDSRASIGYMVHGSSPTKYSPLHSAVQRS
ncbi:synaptopodin-2 isoform X2 [Etheostoma spectabile]|uniref:synaptopodin-2 isoform X2 n=1 Tax=Etheostoma spectabile TaxID=54343 RepID=UPI0013AF41A8|nr:synaptopodin-2-like isoform X2 [Etheostoma spectabile]